MKRTTARAALSSALLALAALPAAAQQPPDPKKKADAEAALPPVPDDLPVKVELALGFANHVPGEGFTSVVVDLSAVGPDAPGRVEQVTVQAVDGGNVLVRLGPAELQGATRRRLVGVVPSRPLGESGGLLVSATDAAGRVIGQATVFPDVSTSRLLVVLDRRGAAPTDLSTLRTLEPGANKGAPLVEVRWAAVSVSRVEDLPRSPLGWSGVGAVLLGDLDLEGWPEAESRALAGWLARGGDLVISVGPRASLLRRSLLGRRLGPTTALRPLVDAPPARDVRLGDLVRGLQGTWGLEPTAQVAPAPAVCGLDPAPGDEVLMRDDGRPFALRRRHGLGTVTFVAADLWSPPFLHAPVTARLIESLVAQGPAHDPRCRLLFKELAAVRQPARVGPAFAVLVIYALLAGPIVYFVLRAKKRGLLVWVVIPALTLAFTALVPFYRLVLRDAESTLVGVRLIEARAGDPVAVETTDVLLFSNSLEPKRLELPDGEDVVAFGVLPPRRNRSVPELGLALGAGAEGAGFSLPVALWGSRYATFEATARAPSLEGGVDLSWAHASAGGEPEGRVRLAWDGRTLRNARVVFPGATGALVHRLDATVGHGARIDEPIRATPHQEPDEREPDLGSLIIERLLQGRYLERVEGASEAWLVGQVDDRPTIVAPSNVKTRAFSTIIVAQLPVGYLDTVPFSVARPTREAATVAEVDSGRVLREARVRLAVPGGAGREMASARVRVTAPRGRSLERLGLEVLDASSGIWLRVLPRPEPEDPDAAPLRRAEVALTDPGLLSPDGVLVFRQRFERGRQEADDAWLLGVDVSVTWRAADAPGERGEGQ